MARDGMMKCRVPYTELQTESQIRFLADVVGFQMEIGRITCQYAYISEKIFRMRIHPILTPFWKSLRN